MNKNIDRMYLYVLCVTYVRAGVGGGDRGAEETGREFRLWKQSVVQKKMRRDSGLLAMWRDGGSVCLCECVCVFE